MANWGVIVAQPQRHKSVAEELTAKAITHFIPMVESHTISRRYHRRELRPLLGRYVLVVINHGWEMLQTIRHVSGMLLEPEPRMMVDGKFVGEISSAPRLVPALVAQEVVDRLAMECEGGSWRDPAKPVFSGEFKYGQKVMANTGPLQSLIGMFDGKARKGQDAALFTLFGREQRIVFKKGELTAV